MLRSKHYHGALTTVEKATRWKRISSKTAAELLEQDEEKKLLTDSQRETILKIAGEKYRKGKRKSKRIDQSDLIMRKGESSQEYFARLQKLVG